MESDKKDGEVKGGLAGPTLSAKSLTHDQKVKRLNKEGRSKLAEIEDRIRKIENDNTAKMNDADAALKIEISSINRSMSDKVRPVREDKDKEIKFLKTKFDADSKSLQSRFDDDVAKINVANICRMRQIEDDLNKEIALAKQKRDSKQNEIDSISQKTISELRKERDKLLG